MTDTCLLPVQYIPFPSVYSVLEGSVSELKFMDLSVNDYYLTSVHDWRGPESNG